MKDRILQLLREQDSFAAIEFAIANADALTSVIALDELMRDLYWKQKDLPNSVVLGRAAAQHGLVSASAVASTDAPLAVQLRGKAKAICYNIASFTWRGWGEEGIVITPPDERIGRDAARANLRLAVELNKGDLALSRAHWMIGAHQLSQADYSTALASFRKAVDFARLASERGDEALSTAYCHLTEFRLALTEASRDQLLESIRMLTEFNDGEFLGQFTAAVNIFGSGDLAVALSA
ncbi:MAG TPA: hypothetical protein VFE47_18440 [Tepidisphaeraceae bacterium]|jgi:hypothetical protein|nr:hypothetical protein [Tepidisphaeraceae bacterium]